MQIPLERVEKVKVIQRLTPPSQQETEAADALLVIMERGRAKGAWPKFPHADILRKRYQRQQHDPAQDLVCDLPNAHGTRALIAWVEPDIGTFDLLTRARKAVTAVLPARATTLLVHIADVPPALAARCAEAVTAALFAAVCPMPSFKTKAPTNLAVKTLTLCGVQQTTDIARLRAEAQGNHLARWLTALPGNELTPTRYRKLIAPLARSHGWTTRFLDHKALTRAGAGAFLAVAQASSARDAGMMHLRYRPKRARKNAFALALVGKGICFDTGGVNVKTAKYMNGMQEDMEGSAVALGTLLALTRLKVDFPVDCWLALAENHVGPNAYKPNDVVTAANGTRIEVIHTDAEGRMVLADTLVMAGRDKPDLIIDYATLTGACVYALSTRYSGAISNRVGLTEDVIAAGRDSGERVWPFPNDSDFDDALESRIADVKQCTLEGEADQILAGRFLRRFVPETSAWLHIDLAAGNHKAGLAHIPSDITGFGVRFSLNLLLDRKLLTRLPKA